MRIAVVGATGNVGTRIVNEALGRGHEVTAIARGAARLPPRPGLTPVEGDAHNPGHLAGLLHGHDVVVSAVGFAPATPPS